MTLLAKRLILAALVALAPAGAKAEGIAIVEGVWRTTELSEITISACDAGFCGHISKIVVPQHIIDQYGDDLTAIGTNFTDEMNKDPNLRGRPIHGMRILTLKSGGNPWVFDGEIYNPQDGNLYTGYVEVLDADRIKLNGCVLYNLICQGQEWVRVPADQLAPEAPSR